jgi:Uma2 family endonuclease
MNAVQTVTQPRAVPGMATTPEETGERRFLLQGISWQFYEAFLAELGDRPGVRLTYDRGNLELMTLSFRHEWLRRRLGLVVQVLAEELNLDFQGCGSTTFRRAELERGLESDEGFYIEHEHLIRGKKTIDLTRDPPPDLGIEVEVSRSALDRMAIYAALAIREVWRFDGDSVRVYGLQADGTYGELPSSLSFPFLPLAELVDILKQTSDLSESGMLRACRAWIRSRLSTWKGQANT